MGRHWTPRRQWLCGSLSVPTALVPASGALQTGSAACDHVTLGRALPECVSWVARGTWGRSGPGLCQCQDGQWPGMPVSAPQGHGVDLPLIAAGCKEHQALQGPSAQRALELRQPRSISWGPSADHTAGLAGRGGAGQAERFPGPSPRMGWRGIFTGDPPGPSLGQRSQPQHGPDGELAWATTWSCSLCLPPSVGPQQMWPHFRYSLHGSSC